MVASDFSVSLLIHTFTEQTLFSVFVSQPGWMIMCFQNCRWFTLHLCGKDFYSIKMLQIVPHVSFANCKTNKTQTSDSELFTATFPACICKIEIAKN